MYGLEASLLSALTAQSFLYDDRPSTLPTCGARSQAMTGSSACWRPRPRICKVLADAAIELPPLDRVVSATAPLLIELAPANRNRVEYAARGDLWLHRRPRNGASKACESGKLCARSMAAR